MEKMAAQLVHFRVDGLVLFCPLHQIGIREREFMADIMETWPLRLHWMPEYGGGEGEGGRQLVLVHCRTICRNF